MRSRVVQFEPSPVAVIIMKQLGGSRFRAMTGARDFVGSPDSLAFHIPRARSISRVRITLTPADTYTVAFWALRGTLPVIVREDVYADQLQTVFTNATGLDTHL